MHKRNIKDMEIYIANKGCKLISSDYVDNNTKLEILFSCGHIDFRRFSDFKRSKNVCRKCAGTKKYTYEEVVGVIESCGYFLIDKEYHDCKSYMSMSDKNGYKYYTSFDKITSNVIRRDCPLSRFEMNNPYTIENINLFFILNGIDLRVCDGQKWTGTLDKIAYTDSEGYMYNSIFSAISQMPKINSNLNKFGISNPHTIDNIKNWIRINKKSYYLVDGQKYTGCHKKLKFKCLKCPPEEKEFYGTFSALLSRGGGCPYCNTTYVGNCNNLQYKRPDIASEWDYDKNYPIIPSEVASGTSKKYYWKCSDCGFSYLSSACKRTGNEPRGCPQCNESNIEKRIRKFLEKNSLNFTPQKRFDDCRDMLSLPFDFYLEDFNTLIEGQGLQHFESVDHFGGDAAFVDRKKKDAIKKDYCIKNNIKLLEIPYYDYKNIESILSKELNLNFLEQNDRSKERRIDDK